MEKKEERVILEVTDLIKQFDQFDEVVTAVNRVQMKIYDGEFIAIVGASGSGKSTLLHLLAGLDVPNAGKIIIRGQEITAMDPDELSRFRGEYVGMVFQSHRLIPQFTALENILIPTMMRANAGMSYEENLKKLVSSLDIADRLHHLPSELSGGQQQRVAIARALINLPHIVFADEPTGNLDERTGEAIMQLIIDICREQNTALLLVTHNLEFAERTDRRLVLRHGVLEELS